MKIWDFFCDLVFCCVSLSIVSMFSYSAVVQYHVRHVLIEQNNLGSLANGADYHPPKMLPRSEVWASTVCVSSIQPRVLQKTGQRCVTPTYLSSLPSVVRRVHQGKMAQFKCLGVCSSNPGSQLCGWLPGGAQAGLGVLTAAAYSGVDARGGFAPGHLLPLGCCKVLRGGTTAEGGVRGMGPPRR